MHDDVIMSELVARFPTNRTEVFAAIIDNAIPMSPAYAEPWVGATLSTFRNLRACPTIFPLLMPFKFPENPRTVPANINQIITELAREHGPDSLLRARILHRREDGIVKKNPVLGPGALWCHYDDQNRTYQVSSDAGLLRTDNHPKFFVFDLQGLREPLWPQQTVSLAFGYYEALALRIMGIRAISVLSPQSWNDVLFRQLLQLLAVENIKTVMIWPFGFGRPWTVGPHEISWLQNFDRFLKVADVSLKTISLSSLVPARFSGTEALQWLVKKHISTATARDFPIKAPAKAMQETLCAAFINADSFQEWLGVLPVALRIPEHWCDLPTIRASEVFSLEGASGLVRARIDRLTSIRADSRWVEWHCGEKSESRHSCWGCMHCPDNSDPCNIEIPLEVVADLSDKETSKRNKRIRDLLNGKSDCKVKPVKRLFGERSWYKATLTEVLEIQDRQPSAQEVIVDGDVPLEIGAEFQLELTCAKGQVTGKKLPIVRSFRPFPKEVERVRPFGPGLAELSRFTVSESATPTEIGVVINRQIAALMQEFELENRDAQKLIQWTWLLYSAPYCIPQIGIERGGAPSVFVIGDSSTGKSHSILKLMNYLKFGRRVDAGAVSKTGLLAIPSANELSPGLLPQLDRDFLFIDEAHKITKETWQGIRDARREGSSTYTKVAQGKFQTRARLMCVANPYSKVMADFKYAWDAAPYFEAADIARFDLFTTVGNGGNEIPKAAPVDFSVETLRKLVAHNWSKTYERPEVWHVSSDVMAEIKGVAEELSKSFGLVTAPLYSGYQIPPVVLSWAAAAANLAPVKVDDDIWIQSGHVQFVKNLLIANAQDLKLDLAAAEIRGIPAAGGSLDDLIVAIRSDPERLTIARAFKDSIQLNHEEISGRTKIKQETLRKSRIPWFKELGLLKAKSGSKGGLASTELLRAILPRLLE